MQQNEIYNISLPRGPGPKNKTQKKKRNESGINYPGELKKRRILHGDTKSTRNGSVIGSDVTSLRKVCSFRKTKQKSPPARESFNPPLYFRSQFLV
jgi:hypothetical protein